MSKKDGSTILVTGATGTVGSELVRYLVNSGQNIIIAAFHSKIKADKLIRDKTVVIVSMNYDKAETIADTLKNIDKLFILTPPSVEMVDISYRIVEEARRNRVKLIVKLSAMGADLETGFTGGRLHRQAEEIV